MTTVLIEEDSPQAKQLLEYLKTLSYATVVVEKNFHDDAKKCNAVSVDTFFDELDNRIKKRFDHA